MEMDAEMLSSNPRNSFAFYTENGGTTREEVPLWKDFKLDDDEDENEDRENQRPTTSTATETSLCTYRRKGNCPNGLGASGFGVLQELSLENAIVPLQQNPSKNESESLCKVLKRKRQSKGKKRRSKLTINQQQIREFLRRQENPMNNDLILENLFKYIGAQSLSACRLVSKQWNYHSVPAVRIKHSPIVFNKTCETFRFSRVMKKAANFPYRSFVLKTKYSERVDKYFETFGDKVKNFQVISKAGRETIDFHNLYEVLNRTPNVESLEVVNVDFPVGMPFTIAMEKTDGDCLKKLTSVRITGWFMQLHPNPVDRIQEYSRFVNPIFRRCSNLKSLDLDIFRTTVLPVFLVALKLAPTLDTIMIRCVTEGDISQLLESKLPFKSVTLNEVQLTRDGAILREFMDTIKGSLESLSLRIMGNQEVTPFALPRMAALKVLSLDRYFSTDILPFERIQNSQSLPLLQKLSINQDLMTALLAMDSDFTSTTVVDFTIWMSDLLNSSAKLAIQDDDPEHSYDHLINFQLVLIQNLPYLFPNLKRLTAFDTRCSAIRGIFSSLPNLEELHISYLVPRYARNTVINLSQTLTGIPNSDWMAFALRDWITSKVNSDVEKQAVMNFVNASASPSLRLLKNLKVLKLSGKLVISDASVFLALLTIQPLKGLILRDAAQATLSHTTLDELKKYHEFVSVTPTSHRR